MRCIFRYNEYFEKHLSVIVYLWGTAKNLPSFSLIMPPMMILKHVKQYVSPLMHKLLLNRVEFPN